MKKAFAVCPDCGKKLVFCPELKHLKSSRIVFRCTNKKCKNYGENAGDKYLVLGNKDNFGQTVKDYEKAYK